MDPYRTSNDKQEKSTKFVTKKYNLFIKGLQPREDIKAGEQIKILGSMPQVPLGIDQILIADDKYEIDTGAVNVGQRARLVVTTRNNYPSNVSVSLIGRQVNFKYIGKPLPENKDATNPWERWPKPSPWDNNEDINDKTRWEDISTKGIIPAEVINNDYYHAAHFDVPCGRDGTILLPPWSPIDDIPIKKIKSIVIETENPEDRKYLYIYDMRVGKNSQFLNAAPLSLDMLQHLEGETMNVGQLMTIQIDNRKPNESCKECGHDKGPSSSIRICGFVIAEIEENLLLNGPVN